MTHLDSEHVITLPARFALTLVDTGSLLGGGVLGGQVPSDTTSGGSTPTSSTDLLSSAMSRVGSASALAQQSGAGAQAQNVDSAGASTFASAP